ncbi:uncharacterized protein LOC110110282 [Dendrobium catenatum]|uniref:uncharacterized protein LOC110110282 n=1 Tax=Dendrobium catenatum TaxID=906689 RepID=UPI0009F62D4D|nr:uncharacterized protein LOC110110282 [Dendrobium catenatum]
MLEFHKKKMPHLETLEAFQDSLRIEIMSKKFLLMLDDIWEADEKQDKSKMESVLAPPSYEGLGSKISIITWMDLVALMIAKNWIFKSRRKSEKVAGNSIGKLRGKKQPEKRQRAAGNVTAGKFRRKSVIFL